MLHGYYAPWDHYPKNLYFEEIQNPYLVLDEFYGDWPDTHVRELKEWRKAVTANSYYKGKPHGPGELLFTSYQVVRFMEACYLLLLAYKNNHRRKEKAMTPESIEQARLDWIWFPENLSEKELIDPYKVVKKAFKYMKLQDYREHLREWLHSALYNHPSDEEPVLTEMNNIYDHLVKLYSAAWVIAQTEGVRAVLKPGRKKTTADGVINKEPHNTEPVPGLEIENKYVIDPNAITVKPFEPSMTPAEKLGVDTLVLHLLKVLPTIRSITYLGSYSKPFTYYLLILIDNEETLPEHAAVNKIIDNTRELTAVYPIVHKVQSAVDGLKSKGRFWTMAITKGISVYKAQGLVLPAPNVLSAKEEEAGIHASWKKWCTNGKEFFKGAKRYLEDGNYKLALFLLNQATEHTLIGVLQILLGYRQSVHNLNKLLSLTLLFTDDIAGIFEQYTKEGKDVFELLQNGYSKARYDDNFNVDAALLGMASEKVTILLAKAEALYQRQLEEYKHIPA